MKLNSKKHIERELPKFIEKYTSVTGFEPAPEKALEILQEFREICGASIIVSEVRDGLEHFYFRVRNKKTMKDGDEFDSSKFSHPPPKFTGHGRVNLCRHPVFYGGEKIDVVVQETHIQEAEKFYLTLWRSGDFHPNYVMMHSSKTKSKRLDLHKATRTKNYNAGVKKNQDVNSESFEHIFEKLSELFTIDNWTISSSLGYALLYGKDNYDGIEYPDVKTRSSYNFALKPEAAAKLQLHRVYLCRIKKGKVQFGKTGQLVDGKIQYRNYEEKDHPLEQEGIRTFKE